MSRSERAVKCQPQPVVAGKAIIYARESLVYNKKSRENKLRLVSGKEQIEVSVDTQVKGALSLAAERGFSVSPEDVFKERFTGEELFDRQVLTQVRDKIRSSRSTGRYKALVCHSTDRLARNEIHLGILAEECDRAGVELIFVTEPLDNSLEGSILRQIRGIAGRIENERRRERVMRGRLAKIAAHALVQTGKPLFGYDYDVSTHTRTINEVEAKIVRTMFDLSARKGMSVKQIAKYFNDHNVATPSMLKGIDLGEAKRTWHRSSVLRMLRDETYTGRTFVNRNELTERKYRIDRATGKEDFNSPMGRKATKLASRDKWIELKDCTPAIISAETFALVQNNISEASTRSAAKTRNEGSPFLLRGVVLCSNCGFKMYPRRMHGIRYYKCGAEFSDIERTKGNKCRMNVKADNLEALMWRNIMMYFENPELIEFELRRARSGSRTAELEADLDGVNAQIEKVQRIANSIMTRLTQAITDDNDLLADKFQDDVKMYNAQLKSLRVEAKSITGKIAGMKSDDRVLDKFKDYCAQVRAGLENLSFEAKSEALRALQARVYASSKYCKKPMKIQLNTGAFFVTENTPGAGIRGMTP